MTLLWCLGASENQVARQSKTFVAKKAAKTSVPSARGYFGPRNNATSCCKVHPKRTLIF